ncbi:T6SS effector amidase Tae4 family protein [Thalassolituus sp.]|uniref:T6SS effector amidase Tae4 family protein n=1 Tax=Thalassolituus sp. TaxID=2030822 RepID=UPI003511965C
MKKIFSKSLVFIVAAILSAGSSIADEVVENLVGSPKNSQGTLSYTVPLEFPEGINGLKPSMSAVYSQSAGLGNLGSGFSLSAVSSIARCASTLAMGDHYGGIFIDSRATYCLDGQPIEETSISGKFAVNPHNNELITYSGSYSRPTSWTIKDGTGYTNTFEIVDDSVSDVNLNWMLKEKTDVFGNVMTYHYNGHGQLQSINYSGFDVVVSYTSSRMGRMYSMGSSRTIGYLIDNVALQKNGTTLYRYDFRYESKSGYKGVSLKRLAGITKCYSYDTEVCTREMTFGYTEETGENSSILPHPDNVHTVIPDDVIISHSEASVNYGEPAKGNPSYTMGNLNNSGSPEVCFYSYKDQLVCAISSKVGEYEINELASPEIKITPDPDYLSRWATLYESFGLEDVRKDGYYKYYAGLTFVDLNHDTFDDMCLSDEKGILCSVNLRPENPESSQIFGSPYYASEAFDYESGHQFNDVNRDGYPDLCGIENDEYFKCYLNDKNGNFSATASLSVAGDFLNRYKTELRDHSDDAEHSHMFYKRVPPFLMDMNSDQVKDLCFADREAFRCLRGSYNSSNILLFSTSDELLTYQLYRYVPPEIEQIPYSDQPRTIIDNEEYSRRKAAFKEIKFENEIITLSSRFIDVNSDGLTDICYVKETELFCSLNTETGFLDAQSYTDFSVGYDNFVDATDKYKEVTFRSIFSSIKYQDINADGALDICYMHNDKQHCAFGWLTSFTDFEPRLQITPKSVSMVTRGEYHTNYMNEVLGPSTRFRYAAGMDVYGPIMGMSDITGDGRSEQCMRTVNGIDCHSNEQQSRLALLTSVTDAFGGVTEFEYKTVAQGANYVENSTEESDFIATSPQGVLLTAMRADAGVNAPGSEYNEIRYTYDTLRYDPLTSASSFSKITEYLVSSNKKTETTFYQERYLAGRIKNTTSSQAGKVIEQSSNGYEVRTNRGLRYIVTTSTWKGVRDPETNGYIRESYKYFTDFDGYEYPRVIKEIDKAYGSFGEQIKQTTTTNTYNHNSTAWIIGKPATQSVQHSLTGAEIQSRSIKYEYYPDTMALYRQTMEPDSSNEKIIEFEYFDNGLKRSESVTGLVDDTTKQTRIARFLDYTAQGQVKKSENQLGYQTRTDYHTYCLAPEREYDVNDRLVVTHKYDASCSLYESEYSTGLVKNQSVAWSFENTEIPADAAYTNPILFVSITTDSAGGYSAKYSDRQSRTIKTVDRISKNDNYERNRVQYSYYDLRGLNVANSLPVMNVNGSMDVSYQLQWATTQFDDYFRPLSTTGIAPDGSLQALTFDYQGLTTTEAYVGRAKTTTVGVLGKVVSVSELGKHIDYEYTSIGEVAASVVNNDSSTRITIEYDKFGAKTAMSDPSTGDWDYRFNAFGELYYQKDAENNQTTFYYDQLGRKTSSVSTEGTTSWRYYDSGNGMGQLKSTTSPSGVQREYVYDVHGRVSDEYLNASGKEINRSHYNYDDKGRLVTTEYNKNSADAGMITPVSVKFDQASKLSQVTIPADKLKLFDYPKVEDQYQGAIEQIVQFDNMIRSVEARIRYHNERMVYYEARAQLYQNKYEALQVDTSGLDAAIDDHRDLIARYEKKRNDLLEKAEQFGGLDAKRKYRFKGFNKETGGYKFEYSKCKAKNWFGKCLRVDSGHFEITAEEFNLLPDDLINTCKIVTSGTRHGTGRNAGSHPSRSGEYIGSESTERGVVYKFNICKKNKLNHADIYTSLAHKYELLAQREREYLNQSLANRRELLYGQVNVDVEADLNHTEWVTVSVNPLVVVPVQSGRTGIQVQSMARNEGLQYYLDQKAHYEQLKQQHESEVATLGADLAEKYIAADELLAAKSALLANMETYASLQILEDASQQQAALAGENLVLWAALGYDVNGQLQSELYGNGLRSRRVINPETQQVDAIITEDFTGNVFANTEYKYRADGNLESRTDGITGTEEYFTYTDNQIESWELIHNGDLAELREYTYDSLGNMLQKGENTNSYHDADHPYWLTAHNGVAVTYDNKGNMLHANGNSYTWTSFGKASSIVTSGQTGTTTFQYDASHNRAAKVDNEGTTYYISPTYEQVHKDNGDILHRFNIRNGYETVTTVERYEYATDLPVEQVDNRPQERVAYYSRDIIGSGTLITGGMGNIIGRRFYSPYGEYIDLEGLTIFNIDDIVEEVETDAMVSDLIENHQDVVAQAESELGIDVQLLGKILTVADTQSSLKGFTGHEEIAEGKLVNMNARIYDPAMGRFVSADSVIPDPETPLAFNRYSYVYNNPALANDPDGHFPLLLAAAIYVAAHAYTDSQALQVASAVLLMVASGQAFGVSTAGGAALNAGGTSLVMSAAQSGRIGQAELRSAAIAAASAAVTYQIGHGGENKGPLFKEDWQTVVAHGTAQGTFAIIQGQSFWGAFVAGSVSHGVGMAVGDSGNKVTRTMAASAAGALGAKATGGDAAHGAIAAATVHLFNKEPEIAARKRLPKFSDIEKNFPAKGSPAVYKQIGGKVLWNHENNPDDFSNACALRVSESLNDSGATIPFISDQTGSGSDKHWYIYRVKAMESYLTKTYGDPIVYTGANINADSLAGAKGIVIFDTQGTWSDASGHADIWNGRGCGYKCYFQESNRVLFWEAD